MKKVVEGWIWPSDVEHFAKHGSVELYDKEEARGFIKIKLTLETIEDK